MASDILGLFGGVSPQQMQNQYLDQQMVSPAQLGAQGLLQQVVSLGGNAGSMIGTGAGRLLGGKVAGEVEAGIVNDAIKFAASKGGTPAEKMQAVAEYLADKPGMGAQYLKAVEAAQKLEGTELANKEAKFKASNRTRDMSDTIYIKKNDGTVEPKVIRWTEQWVDGKGWVRMSKPGDEAANEGGANKPMSPQERAAVELQRRIDEGVSTNPVLPQGNVRGTPLPPAGSRGATYDFGFGGFTNEGY